MRNVLVLRKSEKELKVGKWFLIDRETIKKAKEEIRRICNEAGDEGKAYWERFEKSNKIADENPKRYSSLIETYIFEYSGVGCRTVQEIRDMCKKVGDEWCDDVICDLELQMRICNGESGNDLFKKADKLPCVRVIELRNGGIGYFGGSSSSFNNDPPANLDRGVLPDYLNNLYVPYAFRRVLS